MDNINIKIWGLAGAGKTALLNKLHTLQFQGVSFSQLDLDPRSSDPPSSLGVDVAIIQANSVKFSQWNLAGQLQFRKSLWEIYTHSKDFGLIYVVDVSDFPHLHKARNHLCQVLDISPFREIPLAIFANKVDILAKRGESVSEADSLDVLDCIQDRDSNIKIFLISVYTGEGIPEGINWLIDIIHVRKSSR